ncbi:response regulator [Hyalangium rubrum]|uniref:Response regulator n=1 Tax=Hyalangium rubrum TaxID=3103134 RepID=A0ABU5H4P8_9BACT|nr:response regulator [Hyalangium sp. s54d21]MDY7227757.1 response regulator [Hyalangium sp. s54d21]
MKTILLVDDDKYVRARAATAFELHREEFTLVVASNGAEAVQVLGDRPVDLLLTDLWMPVMDGFQLLAHVMYRNPELPVVVLTSRDPWERLICFGRSAQVPCLPKQFGIHSLAFEVRELLQKHDEGRWPTGTLLGFLQLVAWERKTCMLQLQVGERTGTLHVLSGEVVHAETSSLVGERALFEMMGWGTPRLRLSPAISGLRLTIDTPSQRLFARERAPWPRSLLARRGEHAVAAEPSLALI